MPENRFFYGNIWQIMAIEKSIAISVSTNNQAITSLYGNMAILLRKKHQSIIIKSQTRKRGCTMN